MANAFARHLRKNATPAERALWQQLRLMKQYGHHFRRQAPIDHYIADFVDFQSRLVIEVDGGQHTVEGDQKRTAYLESQGFRVVRFWNAEILRNMDGVIDFVLSELRVTPTPSPSPQGGGGQPP
jgi:very-short-patch-repair endonuclease